MGPLCYPWSPGQCVVSQLGVNPLETPWVWTMGATRDTVHLTHGKGAGEKMLGFKGSVHHAPSSPPSPGGGSKCPQWALIPRRPGLTTEGQRQGHLKGSPSAVHPAWAPAPWRASYSQGSVAWGPTGGGPVEGRLSTILGGSTLVPWRGACPAPGLWKCTPPPAPQGSPMPPEAVAECPGICVSRWEQTPGTKAGCEGRGTCVPREPGSQWAWGPAGRQGACGQRVQLGTVSRPRGHT